MTIGDAELNPYLKANPQGWAINPLGLYDCLLDYWDRYGKPLMIAENGFGQIEELNSEYKLHDDYRIDYIKEHIRALQKAVQHGVGVFAYCAWSPIDMVSSGTSEAKKRYSFIYNDQDDTGHGTQKRYPKNSYRWYRNVITTNGNVFQIERISSAYHVRLHFFCFFSIRGVRAVRLWHTDRQQRFYTFY